MLSIFSYIFSFAICTHLLWWGVSSDLLPTFKISLFIFYFSVSRFLRIIWLTVLYHICFLESAFSRSLACLLLMMSFTEQTFLILIKTDLLMISFMDYRSMDYFFFWFNFFSLSLVTCSFNMKCVPVGFWYLSCLVFTGLPGFVVCCPSISFLKILVISSSVSSASFSLFLVLRSHPCYPFWNCLSSQLLCWVSSLFLIILVSLYISIWEASVDYLQAHWFFLQPCVPRTPSRAIFSYYRVFDF